MPRNEANRKKYEVTRPRYASDMSDAEFALIAAVLPARKWRGRKPNSGRIILDTMSAAYLMADD